MTTALVLGRSASVFEEAKAAHELGPIDFTIATGPIAVDYADVDYWLWFHAELFSDFSERRTHKGYPPVKEYWSIKYRGQGRSLYSNICYFDWPHGGSSGLAAIAMALKEKKADRVILAGIPMTADGGRYDDKKAWLEATHHRPAWVMHLPMLINRVKSFSGWTRELLGAPTSEWLKVNVAA